MKLALALTTFLLGTSGAALAQEAVCNQNASWLVIAQDQVDDAGMQMLVRPAALSKIKCEYGERPGDFVVNPERDSLWYEGLAGNYLTTFRSTGPDGNIVIFDIPNRTSIVDLPADSEVTISDAQVVYWERTVPGTDENCPEFDEYTGYGLGAIIAEERILDVTTGEITSTGEKRCTATQ